MADDINVIQPVATARPSGNSQSEQVQGHFPFISWRSVLAGLFITMLVFATLMSLGLAVGGLALTEVIEDRESKGLPIGAAIWFVVSTLVSLFAGSYFAARVSNFITPRIGGAQGLVIASVFFVAFLWQIGMTLGWAGSTIGGAVGTAGRAAGSQAGNVARLYDNPQVQSLLDRATANLNLRSDPEVVAQGVANRLLRGDQEAAKNYLAYQAGITPAEADRRLGEIRGDFVATAENAATTAANVLAGVGWALFGMMVLGALAAAFGGGLGSRENLRHPISIEAREPYASRAPMGV